MIHRRAHGAHGGTRQCYCCRSQEGQGACDREEHRLLLVIPCDGPFTVPQGRYHKGSWHCLPVQREGDGEFRLHLRGWALGAIAGFFLDKYTIKMIF